MSKNFRRFIPAAFMLALFAGITILSLSAGRMDVAILAAVLAVLAEVAFVTGFGKHEFGGQFLDMPAANAVLKEHYDALKFNNLAYKKNPLLAMIPKETAATGKYITVPIIYENGGGDSNTFTNAQGNQTPPQFAEYQVTLKPAYGFATVANQAAEASDNEEGAFIKMVVAATDTKLQAVANRQAADLYRAGTGSVGQIGSITAGGVITLTNPADVVQFGQNMTLQSASTDGGVPRATLGFVIGRNIVAGTITVSNIALQGPAGQPTGWLQSDFLLAQGDSNTKLSGLQAWIPTTAPASTDNFYGVNRSVDSRLYGLAYPGQGQPPEEALIDALLLVGREGGQPEHLFLNYGTNAALLKAMGTKREFVDWTAEDADISFRGVKLQGPTGVVEVYVDRNCQAATGYLLQLDVWKLLSLGPVPKILRYKDSNDFLRVANADAMELRVGAYSNGACGAPGWNSAVSFSV